MGYELVGVELVRRGAAGLLFRVYIDQPEGITLDDCAAVSHQLSGVLDVEDPIRERYQLEVSSPGMDRPLYTPTHYARFEGHKARLKLAEPRDGRRNYTGVLRGIEGGVVRIEVEGQMFEVPFDHVESARLVPEF
jgi:ribosome maturation factor RimP